MKEQISCGAIIFRESIVMDQQVLLVHYGHHHWGFPKGHMEGEEREAETAIRETLEETSIHIRLLSGFRKTSQHVNRRGISHKNVFFVATPRPGPAKPVPQLSEITEAAWFDVCRVKPLITFPGDYGLFEKALDFWKKHRSVG